MWLKSKAFIFLIFVLTGLSIVILHGRKISNEPVNLWETASQDKNKNQLFDIDCAVVLTGAPGRVREGFELLQQKKVKKLILSGVYLNATFDDLFPYWPYYNDVNPDDVILEKRSQTTLGNAYQSIILVESLKCRDIILITSQLHMARAYSVFRKAFPESIEIKKLTLPNSKSEQSLFSYIIEIVKSIFYSGFGLVNFSL